MEEIRKYSEVVKESIHSIICIDDHYIDTYDDIDIIQERGEDYSDSQEMYRALSTNVGCQTSLVRYDEQKDIASILQNRDLLILDWKLYDTADRPEKTLEILNAAVLADIPYVCIYTKDNIADIFPMCAYFFSGTTNEELQHMFDVSDMLSPANMDMLRKSDFYLPSDITEEFREQLKSEQEELGIDCSKKDELFKLFLAQKVNKVDSKYLVSGSMTHICDNYDIDKKVLCVKDTVILFMQKDEITAEQVLDKIVDAVKEVVENTVVNIIWLNYSNQFKRALRRRNSFLHNVKPEAFAYCVKKFSNSESDLESFVRDLYRQELDDLVMAYNISIPSELKKSLFSKIDKNLRGELGEQLITINSRIMINHTLSKIEHNLQIGDMFSSDDGFYWLCVTALCDCARPKINLENDYIFVRGQLVSCDKRIDVIKRAESRWDSYVELNNEILIIEWEKTIKSICIEKEAIEKNGSIEGLYKNKTLRLKYIGALKEKYVQRIANEVFSQAGRVGVSLANTRQIEGRVKEIDENNITIETGPGECECVKREDIEGNISEMRIGKKVYWDSFGWSMKQY